MNRIGSEIERERNKESGAKLQQAITMQGENSGFRIQEVLQ